MCLKLKNKINLKLKVITFLVLFICCCQKNIAQEFEWAYTIPGLTVQNNEFNLSRIKDIVTNSNNEIYIIGHIDGPHDFGNQTQSPSLFTSRFFLVKLDQNKNFIWVKLFSETFLHPFILLDSNENVVIGGNFWTSNISQNINISLDPDFHPVTNPSNIYENLEQLTYYGFVLKLDSQGNYLNSKIYEDIVIEDITVDNIDNIIAVGSVVAKFDISTNVSYEYLRAFITKLDTNLTTIWDKTYSNTNDNHNAFYDVGVDSQNNLYCSGTYRNTFSYGGTTFTNESSEFICKMLPNGNENWIIELHGNPEYYGNSTAYLNRRIQIDASDNIYFFTNYDQSYTYNFTNTTIDNLPFSSNTIESVIFKIDSNGNHIWNTPLYGDEDQIIIDFKINHDGELITIINSSLQNLHYSNDSILEANGEKYFLLKTNEQGNLIDFKRLNPSYINCIETDTNNNIIFGGLTNKITDFDPHPFNEYMHYPATYTNILNNLTNENVAYAVKLSSCDTEPLFLNTYNFCSVNNANPTIGDIEPNDYNVNWYSSANATTPLDNDFSIIDGTTYYMEKSSENCPVLLRQPVLMNILPPPSPPIIALVQPCYFQGMKLSDLDIQGTNLTFYDGFGNILNSNSIVDLNTEYYVTQNANNCESTSIRINLGNLNLITHSHIIYVCDNEIDNIEVVNLSNYIQQFTITPNLYTISYYNSYSDAFNNLNPILNYTNFSTGNEQTVYLCFYSNDLACFEVVELTINHVFPPEILEIQINDLAANNSITVIPYNEDYVYSLNGINFQASNYFDNLSEGEYFVYVKDKNDTCQPVTETAFILAYPKFFTPNGDGYNDIWKIKFSSSQEILNVEIYDRFGKLITTLDKDSNGWDGTINEKILPSTDYWFKIIRVSDQKNIYRGHFTLKR
jgi:gliding motility-associated-like protein